MHLWGGINHLNIWDMPHFLWVGFRDAADEWSRAQEASK